MRTLNKKGFTILEIIAVVAIISMLLVVLVPRFDSYIQNNRIDTVESELRSFAMGLNNYAMDYGDIYIDPALAEGIYKAEAKNYLDLLNQAYLSSALSPTLTDITPVSGPVGYTHFRVPTQFKKDPWGNKYEFIFYTRQMSATPGALSLGAGIILIKSNGPDGKDNSLTYADGDFGDDIVLIVQNKK